jgi:hypothetical protein
MVSYIADRYATPDKMRQRNGSVNELSLRRKEAAPDAENDIPKIDIVETLDGKYVHNPLLRTRALF